jgi:hypothetical protein
MVKVLKFKTTTTDSDSEKFTPTRKESWTAAILSDDVFPLAGNVSICRVCRSRAPESLRVNH